MDEVTPIGSPRRRRRSKASVAAQTRERALLVLELRAGGKLPSEIASALGTDNQDVDRLLQEQFAQDAAFLTGLQRDSLLGMQFLRLEKLLAAVWPSAMLGDPKSVHEAGDLVMKEARLTGLEQIDPVVNKNLVLVMGDKEEDYIAALRATNSD
jgi:hypothetical protein